MKSKVKWLEWCSESFEKAKREGKPVLLDLTAVWCHWCHVMDSTSYSDEDCARIINEDFVPVQVDIDKRPDIRERYNMGGFPSTVFLNPEGYIIIGDTYVPPQRFRLMLESVKNAYNNRRDEINQRLESAEKTKNEQIINKATLNEGIIKEVLLSVEDNFDSFYGGFGTEPKFPHPEVLDLLFVQYQKTGNKKYIDMALNTLDGMHEGIYDKIDFGFFRYSVAQSWKVPHYEKMLDTNAGLLRNYGTAYDITKEGKYKKIAEETIEYINKCLSDQKNGGFYGSQDADEEFYLSKPEERKNKEQPYIDRTIYVDWNAMMISSYLKAGKILNDEKAINFAVKTADFILENYYGKDDGIHHCIGTNSKISGLLSDNIYFLDCLIDVYSTTQNKKYLEKTIEIAEFIIKNFHDGKNGGFFDKVQKENDIGALKRSSKQFLENSFCAIVFLKLYFLTKEERYKQAAENALLHFSGKYLNFGHFAAMYAIAVDLLVNKDAVEELEGKN